MKDNSMKLMYDKFLDRDELTTKELLALGFTNNDLSQMVEQGSLARIRRGYYSLTDVSGLIEYVKVLFKDKKQQEGKRVLERCLMIEPENVAANTMMLYESVVDKNFEQAFKCLDVLISTNSSYFYYEHDYNLWLFLLSFITDVPEKYRDKVKNMQFEQVFVYKGDLRYKDSKVENNMRTFIIGHNFPMAVSAIVNNHRDPSIYSAISAKLCYMAQKTDKARRRNIYTMVLDGKYEQLIEMLDGFDKIHGLSVIERNVYNLVKDLLSVMNDKSIPEVLVSETNRIDEAIGNHDYKRVIQLSRQFNDKCQDKIYPILGKRILEEIKKNKESTVSKSLVEVPSSVVEPEVSNLERTSFAQIAACLMKQDVEGTFEVLNRYLEEIGRSEYRGFIVDLIKLSLLNKDAAFIDPMHSLSRLARDDYKFDVAVYIQDFYFNLVGKDYKKAAIYLDIISMSSLVGDIDIDTTDMRRALINEAREAGFSEEELGLTAKLEVPKVEKTVSAVVEPVVVSEVVSSDKGVNSVEKMVESVESAQGEVVGAEEVVLEIPVEEGVTEEEEYVYTLVDVIDDVLENTNLIMLEPMTSTEIDAVLRTVKGFENIQTQVIQEKNGDRRVVLRYMDKGNVFVDIAGVLREANSKFRNWEYNEAIDLYQSILPKLDKPKSFIYKNLGFSYERTTYDGDYSKAIDYLTMATVQSVNEEQVLDYTDTINQLKKKCGYNGIHITTESSGDEKVMGVQYKKTSDSIQGSKATV